MRYKLNINLGFDDARTLNGQFNAGLTITQEDLSAGRIIDLPEAAAEAISKKYPALLESVNGPKSVRGVAESAKVKGVNDQT